MDVSLQHHGVHCPLSTCCFIMILSVDTCVWKTSTFPKIDILIKDSHTISHSSMFNFPLHDVCLLSYKVLSGLPLTLRTPKCTQGKFYDCCTDPLLSVSCPSPAPRNNNHGITGAGCSSSSYISQSAHHHSASNHLSAVWSEAANCWHLDTT